MTKADSLVDLHNLIDPERLDEIIVNEVLGWKKIVHEGVYYTKTTHEPPQQLFALTFCGKPAESLSWCHHVEEVLQQAGLAESYAYELIAVLIQDHVIKMWDETDQSKGKFHLVHATPHQRSRAAVRCWRKR